MFPVSRSEQSLFRLPFLARKNIDRVLALLVFFPKKKEFNARLAHWELNQSHNSRAVLGERPIVNGAVLVGTKVILERSNRVTTNATNIR